MGLACRRYWVSIGFGRQRRRGDDNQANAEGNKPQRSGNACQNGNECFHRESLFVYAPSTQRSQAQARYRLAPQGEKEDVMAQLTQVQNPIVHVSQVERVEGGSAFTSSIPSPKVYSEWKRLEKKLRI